VPTSGNQPRLHCEAGAKNVDLNIQLAMKKIGRRLHTRGVRKNLIKKIPVPIENTLHVD